MKYMVYKTNFSSIYIIMSFLIISIMGYNGKNIEIIILIMLFSLFGSLSATFYSLFQSFEKMEYQSIGHILQSALLLGGTLFLIYYKVDLFGFALLYFFVGLSILIYTSTICGLKFNLPKIEIDLEFWKILLKKALPLSLFFIFDTIAFRIDIILLSILVGNMAVGIYSAAYRLMEVLIIVPAVYNASIFPVFSRLHKSSQDSLKTAYIHSFKYLTFLGLPIATGITLLADKIILLIYGSQFTESILALQIVIWAIPLIFLTYLSGTLMISIDKQNIALKTIIVATIINIVLNIMFIPSFGLIAAAIITVITGLIEITIFFYYLSKFIYKIEIRKIIIKPVIASIIMGLFIVNFNLDLFISIITSILFYLISLILLGTFSKEDFNIVRNILKLGHGK